MRGKKDEELICWSFLKNIYPVNINASALIFTSVFPSCSVIYFPPEQTVSGHPIPDRNTDYGWYPLNYTFNDTSSESQDVLVDDDAYFDPSAQFSGGDRTSISSMQAFRMILEHCATIDEAKQMIRSLDIMTPFEPML